MRRTVVLVDDHESFRRAARRLIQSAGYEVIGEAATALDAVRLAQSLSPDVVVVDVLLPDGSGFDITQQLDSSVDRPLIVLISSRNANDFGDRLANSPADAFIAKADLTAEILVEVIGR